MSKTAKRMALGTLFAAVAGYLAGLLTAPKSGRETRADIKNKATEQISEAEKQLKKLHTELNDLLRDAKKQAADLEGKARKEYDDMMEKTAAVREKVREVLSNVHEGNITEDEDLQKAIGDANKAVESLKKYVKKEVDKVSK